MKKYIIVLFTAMFALSCNDEFLNKTPLDSETEKSFFSTYDNCKMYSWQFYAWFGGYPLNQDFMDTYSDNGFYAAAGNENPYSWNKVVEPTGTGGGGYYYSRIRIVNIMLDNINNVNMSDTDKAHWRSVCYFFKSMEYFRMMTRFGDVIWEEHALTEMDQDIIYGPATPRIEIATKILEMLQYAKTNIKVAGDGANTINLNVVNAFISRFGLSEGTWQKYHAIAGGEPAKYFQASYDASTALITAVPNVHTNYNEVFNSEDLGTIPSVLLYKIYITTKGHIINRNMGSSESWYEASSELVQSYLCSDGKPIWTSSVYQGDPITGDATMNVEFRNRDRRLLYSICPPYQIINVTGNKDLTKITYTNDPQDREYVDLMATLSTATAQKTLPVMQWSGEIVREIPHFRNARYNVGQGFSTFNGGYYPWKIYTPANQTSGGTNDAPLFRMGEVMVNHAEAAWELGKFNQTEADKSINKLRIRAGIAAMVVADINASFDPKRDIGGGTPATGDNVSGPTDYAVDPVLWEIRRERRIELYCEGFRYDDLRRWGKGKYLNSRQFGAYVLKTDYEDVRHITDYGRNPGLDGVKNFSLPIVDPTKDGGRLTVFGTPTPGWFNKYYLYPIPLMDLTLNDELNQNPGYKGLE